MDRFVVRGAWLLLGWIATALMAFATLVWLWSVFTGRNA
jgi:hypothetical protein